MTDGTVQNPLTQGEIFDLGAAIQQQIGRNIDPDKARYYLKYKRRLGRDLRKLDIYKMPEFDTTEWERLYSKHFGLASIDFSGLHVPSKPDYPCRAVVVVPQVTNNQAFDACNKAFKTWRYTDDLDTVRDVVVRPSIPYVVWVRDTVEADPDMANKSSRDIEAGGINTLTLKERLLLELSYFEEKGLHLDIHNWTLCAGSRYAGGHVPNASWGDGGFHVNWTNLENAGPRLRARVAVS